MKTTFTPNPGNKDFNHQIEIRKTFENLGFKDFSIQTCLTNGISHYVSINLDVLDEGKMPMEVFIFDGIASVQVRISDHTSNLERFGGVSGNKISFQVLESLLSNNIAKPRNI